MALSLFGLLGFSRRDGVKIEQDVWRGTISYPLKLFFTVSPHFMPQNETGDKIDFYFEHFKRSQSLERRLDRLQNVNSQN